jgi:hypothetical protein
LFFCFLFPGWFSFKKSNFCFMHTSTNSHHHHKKRSTKS